MEILQLKYFMHTAESENISQTARKFIVPPSSVSSSIKKLEIEMGTMLFERGANRLKLSPSGKILYDALKKAEEHFYRAQTEILNLSEKPLGEIKLLILNNRNIVTETISDFKKKYPDVSLNIKHSFSGINFSDFDVIVSDRIFESSSFRRIDFVNEEVFLAVCKNNPLSKFKSVSIKNLAEEKFILMPKGASIRDFSDKYFKKEGVEPKVVIECDDPAYIRQYVKIGLGVTLFPFVSWNSHIGENISLLRIGEGIFRKSYIYLTEISSYAAKLFSDALQEKCDSKYRLTIDKWL